MILLILLLSISFGVGAFIVSQVIDWGTRVFSRYKHILHADRVKRCRKQIEKDLDWLTLLHEQGIVSEKQFSDQADGLIDELVDTLRNSQNTRHYNPLKTFLKSTP